MKSKFLFPTWCVIVGYLLVIPGFILGYLTVFNKYEIPGFGFKLREADLVFKTAFENFTNELAIFLVVIGLLLIAFSKDKKEDELTAKMRLNALYWGIMVYYVLYITLLLSSLLIGELPFVGDHVSELNIFTPLLIFICRYNYLKYFNPGSYLLREPKFLPHQPFKTIGISLFFVAVIAFIGGSIFSENLLTNFPLQETYLVLVTSAVIWAFSRNKIEDEMTMQLRMENMQLAVYFNYAVLLIATICFYSVDYLVVLLFAQFSLLLFFIIRMEYVNYQNKQLLTAAEGGIES